MNEKSLENLQKYDNFSSKNQPPNENKSNGQIIRSIKRNLLETLRSRIDEKDLIANVVDGVCEEVENGNYKNAIELIKIAKEPDKQDINLNGELGVQKIFVTPEMHKATLEHIKQVINDQ